MFSSFAVLFYLLFATYTDLKERIVPDFLTFFMFIPLPSGRISGIIKYSPVVGIVKITTDTLDISILRYFIIYLILAAIVIYIAKKVLEKDESLKL